jgi:hypothetical protein
MKSILIRAAIGILFTYFGFQLADKGLSSPSDATVKKYEQLCKHSIKTSGLFDSTYSETTIKVLKGSSGTKFNNFTYTYFADNQVHNGNLSMTSMPSRATVDIWYDPANPNYHVTADPCKQYDYAKSKQYPALYWYIGIPMLLVGISMLYALMKSGIKAIVSNITKPTAP